MDEEYNPFQNPAAPAPTSYYPAPSSLYGKRPVVPFASGHVCAMFAMSLLALLVVVDLLGVWASISQNNLLDALMQGQTIAPTVLETNDEVFKSIAIADGIVNLSIILPFVMWVHRTYRNLPALGAPKLESTPGWAVGWYFVPIAFLFKPFQTMSETWRYSDPAQFSQIRKTTGPLVGIWWAAFLITRAVDRIGTMGGDDARPTLESLKSITNGCIVAFSVECVAAIIAIALVFSINKNQQAMHDLIAAQPPSEPATGYTYG